MVVSFLLMAALTVDAQEPLVFAQVLARVKETHPALVAAREGVTAARHRSGSAGAWDDPMVGAQVWSLPLSHVEGALMPGMSARDRARTFLLGPDQYPLMVTASQTFPWPGKRGARTEEARAMTREAEAMVDASSADIDRAVAYAYAELRAASLAAETTRGSLHLLETAISVAETRLETATGSLAETLAARAEREGAERELIDLAQQAAVARARLAALMGVSPSTLGPAQQAIRRAALPPREQLLERALAARPELRAAQAQVAAAVARARAERLAAFPDVTVSGGYTLALGGLPTAVDQGPYRALLGPADMLSVGVSVPVPIFYPWKQSASAAGAEADSRRAQANAEAIIRATQNDVDEALAGLARANEFIRLHGGTLISLSERSANAAEAAYASGKGDLVMLLNAARMVRSHHLEFLSSETEYARRLADLQRVTGMELVAFGTDAP